MNLDQLTIEIRPRRAWEAVDLGLLMARQWWVPMIKVWLLLTLPLFLVLNLLPQHWLWLSYMIIWWLKPVFERPLLHMLSQAVFNEMPSTRATIKVFPRLARLQIFASLTWRRLSPTRSMDLALVQLEGLKSQRRAERLAVLHREDSSPATWLTILGSFIEFFLAVGILMVIFAFVPSQITVDWRALFNDADAIWFAHLVNVVVYIVMALSAPFYVACGFSLYLNRRIKLEAWDIDIAFQRIVNKRSAAATTLTALVLVISLGMSLLQTPKVMADDQIPVPVSSTDSSREPIFSKVPTLTGTESESEIAAEIEPIEFNRTNTKEALDRILAGPDFHQKKMIKYPAFFDQDEEKKPSKEQQDLLEKLRDLIRQLGILAGMASFLEIVLWLGVICLIIFVVYRYRHWLAAYLPQRIPELHARIRPVMLFGMDVSRESLPKDVSANALELWRKGNQRAALALLYRACLIRLLDAGLAIEDGHTEIECLKLAEEYADTQPNAQNAIQYFAELTTCWRRLAYGHIDPDPAQGEMFCSQWNNLWRASAQEAQDE